MTELTINNIGQTLETPATDAPASWTAFLGAFSNGLEWALDLAAQFARNYPDEVATIERVRSFVRARVANRSAPIKLDDVVFAFTLAMGALEMRLSRFRNQMLRSRGLGGAADVPVVEAAVEPDETLSMQRGVSWERDEELPATD